MNKSVSLFALSSIALASTLMADELLPQAKAVEIEPVPEIAICRMPAPAPSAMKELKDMEANDESIQSILQSEEAKDTLAKLNAPIVLNSMEDALKHLTRASMEKIADQVNFEKEQVVVFAWQGSGQDRLSGHVRPGKNAVANLQYTPGRTKDLKTHSTIFAMPKDVEVKVHKVEHRVIRCGVGQLEGRPMQLQIEPGVQKLELKLEQAK